MDQELKAYLDEQFARQGEQFARQGEQLARQEERLTRLEERVIESSRQIESLQGQIGGLQGQVEGLQEEARHTRVLIEGVWSHVRLIAEGLVGVTERLEAYKREMDKGFEDVKASIAPAYQDLDRRVRWLEARAERRERDVFEVIREEFGIPKT